MPGQPTKPNEWTDDWCTPNTPPDNDSTNEGTCAAGPFESYCTIEQYRFALTSWVATTATAAAGSRMQPIEVGMRAMARTNAAAQDLELLPLLREELG